MLENIRLAFQGIWSHKLRSILTNAGYHHWYRSHHHHRFHH